MGIRGAERALLERLFREAVAAVSPAVCVPPALPAPPTGRTVILGAGKAAAAMARAVEERWAGHVEGLVVTPYGHGVPCRRVEVVEAAHPVPDSGGRRVAARILALARRLGAGDLALCLLSGGGSALLSLPAPGMTLEHKRAVTAALLASGAPIAAINTVRKHLSAIKGGRLAAACHPARVVALAISDVPGDDPAVVASGPTVADPTTAADALAVLRTYGVPIPGPVFRHLQAGGDETPKPGDRRLAGSELTLVATASTALAAAARSARAAGLTPVLLSDRLEGEARDLARTHARLAVEVQSGLAPPPPPCLLLSGGETTVTVRGDGTGGRNSEYLLALGLALAGRPGIWALAADTDGLDGTSPSAGALLDPTTLRRARSKGLDPAAALAANDTAGVFAALGDHLRTGPTRTNVSDFRALLIYPQAKE